LAVATHATDKLADTTSVVQPGALSSAGARSAAPLPPGRRRRASMQDALDHTKINTSLYDPTLVRHTITVIIIIIIEFYSICSIQKYTERLCITISAEWIKDR